MVAECVQWFDDRGFGFVRDVMKRKCYFVHETDLMDLRGLQVGDIVKFQKITKGVPHDRAIDVVKAG